MSRSGFSGCRSRKFGAVSQVAHANVLWAWIQIRGRNHCKTMQTIDAYQLCASKNAYYIYRHANIHSANMCKSYLLTVSASQHPTNHFGHFSVFILIARAFRISSGLNCHLSSLGGHQVDSPKLLRGLTENGRYLFSVASFKKTHSSSEINEPIFLGNPPFDTYSSCLKPHVWVIQYDSTISPTPLSRVRRSQPPSSPKIQQHQLPPSLDSKSNIN